MYIYTVPYGGFGIDVLGNSLKVTLGIKEECSFALKTEIDSQDAANVGIVGSDPFHHLLGWIGQILV